MLITLLLPLATLPLLVSGACSVPLGCFENADCSRATTDGICAGGDMATLVMGCCGLLATTTHRTITNSSCVDKINPMTGTSDCARNARLCDVAAYYSVMSDQCPRTCGRCGGGVGGGGITVTTNTTRTCVDLLNPMTGRSDCPERRVFCNNSAYASLMKVQCPATCGFCTSG